MNMLHNEIERKFLVKKMPLLFFIKKTSQERYFIQYGDLVEEGYKRTGSKYEYEIKTFVSPEERTREKRDVTKEEFEAQKENGSKIIERDCFYLTKKSPIISIKKYKGLYNGLNLAEVEFDSTEERENFVPPSWMGVEVTDTPLGKDSTLISLDEDHFLKILNDMRELTNFDPNEEGVL